MKQQLNEKKLDPKRLQEERKKEAAALANVPSFLIKTYDIVNVSLFI